MGLNWKLFLLLFFNTLKTQHLLLFNFHGEFSENTSPLLRLVVIQTLDRSGLHS